MENVIRRLKVFRVLGERYRNKRRRYGIKVNIIAGIVNLLMGFEPIPNTGTRPARTAFKIRLSQQVYYVALFFGRSRR